MKFATKQYGHFQISIDSDLNFHYNILYLPEIRFSFMKALYFYQVILSQHHQN